MNDGFSVPMIYAPAFRATVAFVLIAAVAAWLTGGVLWRAVAALRTVEEVGCSGRRFLRVRAVGAFLSMSALVAIIAIGANALAMARYEEKFSRRITRAHFVLWRKYRLEQLQRPDWAATEVWKQYADLDASAPAREARRRELIASETESLKYATKLLDETKE